MHREICSKFVLRIPKWSGNSVLQFHSSCNSVQFVVMALVSLNKKKHSKSSGVVVQAFIACVTEFRTLFCLSGKCKPGGFQSSLNVSTYHLTQKTWTFKRSLYQTVTDGHSTSLPDWKHGKIAFQHFQKCTMQIFVIGVYLTVFLPCLINRGYTQVYVMIFTQHPPDIDTLKKW